MTDGLVQCIPPIPVWCGATWLDLTWLGLTWLDLAWLGLAWLGLACREFVVDVVVWWCCLLILWYAAALFLPVVLVYVCMYVYMYNIEDASLSIESVMIGRVRCRHGINPPHSIRTTISSLHTLHTHTHVTLSAYFILTPVPCIAVRCGMIPSM